MKHKMQLLESQEYLDDLINQINKAKTRVYILAMVIIHDEVTDGLIEALKLAASRGLEVVIAADIFTFTESSGFILTNSLASKKSRRTSKTVKQLKKYGVKFRWLGVDKSFILMGRTHTKLSVVDYVCYTFGGMNIYDGAINSYDYMIKIIDPLLAGLLTAEFQNITRADQHRLLIKSREIGYEGDKILIDGGMLGGSKIYARACHHAQDSKKIIYVSQYCPSGKLAKYIAKVKVHDVYYNPKQNTNFVNSLINSVGKISGGLETIYTKSRYLHAKFIIFYKNDGSVVAITGSHNFSFSSVMAGTREVALETTNKKLIKRLEKFVSKNLIR